ncbi:MAG: hypothetical protein WCJ64_05760 [Rhodospirillaceae bacterium]
MITLLDFLKALEKDEWLSSEVIAERLKEEEIEYVYQKAMYSHDRHLIESKGGLMNWRKRLYMLTKLGIQEISKIRDTTETIVYKVPVTGFGYGKGSTKRRRKHAAWRAIMSAMNIETYVTSKSLRLQCSEFYKSATVHHSLNDMNKAGLIERCGTEAHRRLILYRLTPDGVQFLKDS